MVQQTSELEMNIVAVERVKEYSEVEQEVKCVVELIDIILHLLITMTRCGYNFYLNLYVTRHP